MKKNRIDWCTFCGALRNFIRESNTKQVDKLVTVEKKNLSQSHIDWVKNEIVEDGKFESYGKENPFTCEFVESIFSENHKQYKYTEKFKWEVHISALKYYMGRMTIASATYPSDFLKAYNNHFSDDQMDEIHKILSDFLKRANGFGCSFIDLPIWMKFMSFCDWRNYEDVKLTDGTSETVFFSGGRYYAVDDYTQFSYERYLPMYNISNGESKKSVKEHINVCQSRIIVNALNENGLQDLIPETAKYWAKKNGRYCITSKKTDLPALTEDELIRILSNNERFGIKDYFVPSCEFINNLYYMACYKKKRNIMDDEYAAYDLLCLPFRNDGTSFNTPKDAYAELLYYAIANIRYGNQSLV